MKKLVFFFLFMVCGAFLVGKVEAKVWTKELVDNVVLIRGYKFQVCPTDSVQTAVDIVGDFGLTKEEEYVLKNPEKIECSGDKEELLLGTVKLTFNKEKYPGVGTMLENLIVFQNNMYALQGSGSTFSYEINNQIGDNQLDKTGYIADFPGLKSIKKVGMLNTDPNVPEEARTIKESAITIFHDKEGKFTTFLFVINRKIYKSVALIREVGETLLVDYAKQATYESNPLSSYPSATAE